MRYLPTEPPACWWWPVPPLAKSRDDEDARAALRAWNNVCAICGGGGRWARRLVEDHNHETGLIRGRLCGACNTAEGLSSNATLTMYRERNPASILGLTIRYWSQRDGFAWPVQPLSMEEGRAVVEMLERSRSGPPKSTENWLRDAVDKLNREPVNGSCAEPIRLGGLCKLPLAADGSCVGSGHHSASRTASPATTARYDRRPERARKAAVDKLNRKAAT